MTLKSEVRIVLNAQLLQNICFVGEELGMFELVGSSDLDGITEGMGDSDGTAEGTMSDLDGTTEGMIDTEGITEGMDEVDGYIEGELEIPQLQYIMN